MDVRQDEPIVPPHDESAPGYDPGASAVPEDPVADPYVQRRSLFDDVEAMIDDAKLYFDAELTFQKTRAAFMVDALKRTLVFGIVGAFFGMLATIGLAIGLIIALAPILTPWGATAVVVGLLLVLAFLALRKASKQWSAMMAAIEDRGGEDDDNVEA